MTLPFLHRPKPPRSPDPAWESDGPSGSSRKDGPQEGLIISTDKGQRKRRTILNVKDETDGRVEHEFFLRKGSIPVFSLRCKSRAKSASQKPVYFDGDVIEGGVQLMAQKSIFIEEITLKARGRIAPPEIGRLDIFWKTTETLWKSSRDLPVKSPLSPMGNSKLPAGNYSWSFAVHLPVEVEVQTNSSTETYRLPPSYRRSGITGILEYEIAVHAYRGILRDPLTLVIPFVYIPRSSPQYPSGKFLSRPDDDMNLVLTSTRSTSSDYEGGVEGCEFRRIVIEGTVFADRMVQVVCRAAYKRPLVYARGTSIRITVLLDCDDSQALDLVASPECVTLSLEQKATVAGDQVFKEVLATAFCTVTQRAQYPNLRTMEALITCPRDVKPTFFFATFVLEHFLTLHFNPPTFFVPTSRASLSFPQAVKIVTDEFLP